MSQTDRIEQARKHLTSLMAERDRVAARNPVDLNRLRYLDAAIDAEIAGAVAAYEDVLAPTSPPTPVPLPPPPQWDHTVRIQAAQRPSPPDVSYLEQRAVRRRVLLACTVLVAFLVTAVLLFTFWPTAKTLKSDPADDRIVEERPPTREDGAAPVAPPTVPPAAPSVALAQLAAAPVPDEAPMVVEAVTAPEREVHPEPSAKAKKSKRKRRKRKRRRKRKDRKIKMGNSRDPLSGL